MLGLHELFEKLKREKGGEYYLGDKAIKRAGLPPKLLKQMRLLAGVRSDSYKEDSYIACRVSAKPPSYKKRRRRWVAKSGDIFSKCSNHGLVKGVLPIIPALTKIENGRTRGHDPRDRLNEQETIQLSLSLRDLMEEITATGDLEIAAYVPTTQMLSLKYKEGKEPITSTYNKKLSRYEDVPFVGQFIINLNDGKKVKRKNEFPLTKQPEKPQQLENLSAQKFTSLLDLEFPIFYRKSKSSAIESLKVFAKNKRVITSDVDLFVMSLPAPITKLDPMAGKLFKTLNHLNNPDIDECRNLIVAAMDLFEKLKKDALQKFEIKMIELKRQTKGRHMIVDVEKRALNALNPLEKFLVNHKDDNLRQFLEKDLLYRAGRINPYEFLISRLLNHVFDKEIDPDIKDLIQHGFEGSNLYEPNLSGDIMHLFGDKVCVIPASWTAALYEHDNFLEKYPVFINHTWPIKDFEAVILKQHILGQKIRPETIESFRNHYILQRYARHVKEGNSENFEIDFDANKDNKKSIFEIVQTQIDSFQNIPPVVQALFLEKLMQKARAGTLVDADLQKFLKQINRLPDIIPSIKKICIKELQVLAEPKKESTILPGYCLHAKRDASLEIQSLPVPRERPKNHP